MASPMIETLPDPDPPDQQPCQANPHEPQGSGMGKNPTSHPTLELSIRVGYPTRQKTDFNVVTNHLQFLQELKKVDPQLEILPASGKEGQSFGHLSEFPQTEDSFKQFFAFIEHEQLPTGKAQAIVCHTIRTQYTLYHLKNRMNEHMLKYLKLHNLQFSQDAFNARKIVAVGHIFGAHPRLFHRTKFRDTLAGDLHLTALPYHVAQELNLPQADLSYTPDASAMNVDIVDDNGTDTDSVTMFADFDAPSFELQSRPVFFGRGAQQVRTEALEITCAADDQPLLLALFSQASIAGTLTTGQFIPRGAATHLGHDAFFQAINQQNQYLQSVRSIPLLGLTSAALDATIMDSSIDFYGTLEHWLLLDDAVHSIQHTNDNNTGEDRKFILTDVTGIDQVRHIVDKKLPVIFKTQLTALNLRNTKQPIPIRTDKPRTTSVTTAYAKKLQEHYACFQSGTTAEPGVAAPPARARRPPTKFLFSSKQFPTLSSGKKPRSTAEPTSLSPPQSTNAAPSGEHRLQQTPPANTSNEPTEQDNFIHNPKTPSFAAVAQVGFYKRASHTTLRPIPKNRSNTRSPLPNLPIQPSDNAHNPARIDVEQLKNSILLSIREDLEVIVHAAVDTARVDFDDSIQDLATALKAICQKLGIPFTPTTRNTDSHVNQPESSEPPQRKRSLGAGAKK